MRFNTGDAVAVRDDLVVGQVYGKWVFGKDMGRYAGKPLTVAVVLKNSKGYLLIPENDKLYMNYVWTEGMLK